MKKTAILVLFFLMGCASTNIPSYIQDKYPYKRTFYADFDKVYKATAQTLLKYGWTVTGTSDPSVFERSSSTDDSQNKQILIFTDIRQTSLFFGTRYARINAYIRTQSDHSTEVEIRYLTISSMSFKNFYNYRKDKLIERMFKHIEALSKG